MCDKPTLLVSSEAVRIPEKGGMSIPLDAVNFVRGANCIASDRGRTRGHAVRHMHLVNDASMLAAHVAGESSTMQEAIGCLRKLITNGTRNEFEEKLRLYVEMRIKVLKGVSAVLGRDFQIGSTLGLLREKGNRPMAIRMMDIIGAAYRPSVETYDLVDMEAATRKVDRRPDQEPKRRTLTDIALSTVPPRLRKILDKDLQLKESLYAAVEAGFAAALIGDGGEYIAYKGSLKGSEGVNGGPSIIENMKTLVQCAVWGVLNNPDLVREIDDHFIIDQKLDGFGITTGEGGKRKGVVCDPHTLDFGDPSQPEKLPFLIFEDNKLRAVKPEEFRDSLITDPTAGISSELRHAWMRNLGVLDDFLTLNHGVHHSEVKALLAAKGVKLEALLDWATKIHGHLGKEHKGDPTRLLSHLIPGSNIEFTAALVSLMAAFVLNPEILNETIPNVPSEAAPDVAAGTK